METGQGGISRAAERPTPTSHKGKPTFPVIKLKPLAAETLLFQAQYFSPEQTERCNSKDHAWRKGSLSLLFFSSLFTDHCQSLSFAKLHPASEFNLDHPQFRSFSVSGNKTIQCCSFYFYAIVISFKKSKYAGFLMTTYIHKIHFKLSI